MLNVITIVKTGIEPDSFFKGNTRLATKPDLHLVSNKIYIKPHCERKMKMILKKSAVAGTYESSDAHVRVEPNENGIELELESSVMDQYGEQIKESVQDVLKSLEVENAKVVITDKGALDCTLRARVETAIFRACELTESIPWGTKI
jgi:citrate lyase subunit gamma (acyl carrier protein)